LIKFAAGGVAGLLGFLLLGLGMRAVFLAAANPQQLPVVSAWLKKEPAWVAPRLLVAGVASGAAGLALLAWAWRVARLAFDFWFYGG
jgi:hypothetical protein